ncbi:MAG: alpha/beta hydrolase, partial [Planctomycetota bacterium]
STVRHRRREVPIAVTGAAELVHLPPSIGQLVRVDDVLVEDPDYTRDLTEAEVAFHALLRERLANARRKEVYLFVHGYNNTFDDAAQRMAQVWHFMGRPGVALFHTWPAGHPGLLQGYTYDRESSEFTIFHLKQLSRMLVNCPEVERVHVLAHSRGTDVAMSTLRELWIEKRASEGPTGPKKLGSLVLAAADMDWEVFQQRQTAEQVIRGINEIVLYRSEEDKAIGLSAWLFGSLQRLGRLVRSDLTPQQQTGLQKSTQVQIIDARVRAGFLGHAYFVTNPAVLSDLILVMRDGRPPGAEHGRPLGHEGGGFWTLTDSYLTGVDPTPTVGARSRGGVSTMNPNPR